MKSKTDKRHTAFLVKSLGQQLNVSLEKDFMEVTIRIPETIGEGKITGFDLGGGIGFTVFDIKMKEDWSFVFKTKGPPLLYFNFLIEGRIWHNLKEGKMQDQLLPLQSIVSSTSVNTPPQAIKVPKDKKILFASLLIDRKKYLSTSALYFSQMHEKMVAIFKDVDGKRPFFHLSDFSINASRLVKKITKNKNHSLFCSIHIESKILELLSRQLKRVEDDFSRLGRRIKLKKYDAEKIKLAKDILIDNMQNPPTIEKLAKKVGINQQKLKEGFKLIYETTIKKYLTRERLKKAALLLLHEISIRQVAMEIGYSNLSYFAKIFKKRYGILPKDFAKNNRIRASA